jgi:hypothetical protein
MVTDFVVPIWIPAPRCFALCLKEYLDLPQPSLTLLGHAQAAINVIDGRAALAPA